MTEYTATYPLGADPRDVLPVALAALPIPPLIPLSINGSTVIATYASNVLTPTQVISWQTAIANTVPNLTAPYRNEETIANAISNALAQLRTIQTQAATFQGQAAYGVANLANLNDLLNKSQIMAGAVATVALDLIQLCRLISGQFDATN